VFFVAVVVVGVRSFWVWDQFTYTRLIHCDEDNRYGDGIGVLCSRGGIEIFDSGWIATPAAEFDGMPDVVIPLGLSHERSTEKGYLNYPTTHGNLLGRAGTLLGFGFGHWFSEFGMSDTAHSYTDGIEVIFPGWFLAILLAVLPAIWLRRRLIQRKRNQIGLCKTCGYDLRATPNRCPECGTLVPAPAPQSAAPPASS